MYDQRYQAPEARRPVAPAPPTRRSAPRIGFITPGAVERAFVALLYLAMLALIALSVVGTFYGWQGRAAPLSAPRQMLADIVGNGSILAIAMVVQLALSLTQYGARQMARHDRRWWFLYLVALAISVYYNYQAYWTPLQALTAPYVAGLLILAGDVLPEFLAVRHND